MTADPAERLAGSPGFPGVTPASDLYLPARRNSEGVDLLEPHDLNAVLREREAFAAQKWQAGPLTASAVEDSGGAAVTLRNPARPDDVVGEVRLATPEQAQAALERWVGDHSLLD